MKKGIDISYHNGNVNMQQVKQFGVEFIILRVGYRKGNNCIDKKFHENYNKAIQCQIPVGVYLYSYAHNTSDAIQEAKFVLDVVKNLELKYPIYIDMEDADNYKAIHKISDSTCIDICEAFCKYIEEANYYAGIYANLNWLNNKINSNKLDRFDKWVAQWGTKCKYTKEYGMWQYSSKGRITGINGNVDLNYAIKDYPKIIEEFNLNVAKSKRVIYVVQAGDNLTKISKKYNKNWEEIYELNREIIGDNPNIIQIGQELIIEE